MHEIKYIKVEQLNLLEGNPRFITKERFEKLKESIAKNSKYFEARPCLVNDSSGKLVVYAGNQRLRAGRSIGLGEVPCIVETLTAEEERERTIRDNVELGAWDVDLIANDWDLEELKDWGIRPFELSIDNELDPEKEWEGMPEFNQQDLKPLKTMFIHFETEADIKAFSELVQQKITDKTRFIWFPKAKIDRYANKRYSDES